MTKAVKIANNELVLSRPLQRALEDLCGEGAYGVQDCGTGGIAIAASRKGVSVRIASACAAVVKELVARDLACFEIGERSRSKRLMVTDAGRSALARSKADPDLAFLAQHRALEVRKGPDGGKVLMDAEESPLAWLARRKLVGSAEFEAGERLRRDMDMGQMLPSVTANWSSSVSSSTPGAGRLHMAENLVAARQRVDRALAAAGPDLSGILVDVCGFLKGLELIEQERGWPRRSAKVALNFALAAIARHYGLSVSARGPARSAGLRHWGSEDYRPQIEGDSP